MKIKNQHERIVVAPAERIAALIADFDRVWPRQLAPAPRPRGHRLYDAGLMVWEEFDRPASVRAFRVLRPDELQAEHWFELGLAEGGTLVRHTVEGCAAGKYETIWRAATRDASRQDGSARVTQIPSKTLNLTLRTAHWHEGLTVDKRMCRVSPSLHRSGCLGSRRR